ncbi:SRPBCC domain-containing protein [Nocardia sp. NPDC004568]|uniref:SRPBCC domain-containing protein n=1 Tax=Nocardia sp. NPDC004568 TaxID=3154551 RepID=UPI0033AB4DCB
MTDATRRLGEILRDGDRVGTRYERDLAHPPEKVWRALTESEHLRHWFPADIIGERRAGAEVRFRFWPESVDPASEEPAEAGSAPEDSVLPGRILTWEPPRLFEFLWEDEHLLFEIVPDGAGSRLLCTVWFGTPGPHGISGTAAGYHICLDALADLLDTGPGADPDRALILALGRRYAEVIG